MIRFLLNDKRVESRLPESSTVLDFVRNTMRLTGSKLACGEGECGACSVLVGSLKGDNLTYQTMTACITPLANVHGKHVVTVEGLNLTTGPADKSLSPVQAAMVDENGTQCGFCTPGFIVALTGALLTEGKVDRGALISSMDGNVCRCTGYKSIERAADRIMHQVATLPDNKRVEWLVEKNFIPEYFTSIVDDLNQLHETKPSANGHNGLPIGGGSDLYVQRPYAMRTAEVRPMYDNQQLKGISIANGICTIGTSETMSSMQHSSVLRKLFPEIHNYFAPIGSTPIRNMATIGGNLVNASPIGDTTIFFLALHADLQVTGPDGMRTIPLRNFYLGYKKLDLQKNEVVTTVQFKVPPENSGFHFYRVCKREYLDIASVNSACFIEFDIDFRIKNIGLSAGGVAPIPKFLDETCAFLQEKIPDERIIFEALEILDAEISPISDIRGSAEYKRLLLKQLVKLHLTKLAPDLISPKSIFAQ